MRTRGIAAFPLLALLAAGCSGTVIELASGMTTGSSAAGGSTGTGGSGTWTLSGGGAPVTTGTTTVVTTTGAGGAGGATTITSTTTSTATDTTTSSTTSTATGTTTSSTTSTTTGTVDGGAPLFGAAWESPVETVYRVDPTTGLGTAVGPLGTLQSWQLQFVLDRTATHAFALGDSASGPGVYTVDLVAGTSTVAPGPGDGFFLAGVTDGGSLVAFQWTGSAEAVYAIDPSTGSTSVLGEIGLHWWSLQSAYDHAAHIAYAVGSPNPNGDLQQYLFSFSLDTMVAGAVPLPDALSNGVFLGGVLPGGAVVGAYWDGAVERVAEIDPATGLATPVGQLGDLASWNGSMTLDPTSGVLWAYGYPAQGTRLFSLDLTTQLSTEVAVAQPLVLAKY